ncbi:MAG: GAF domain-containing protein [bacterium]|nr:GAF domain-containing protein [bacterium]
MGLLQTLFPTRQFTTPVDQYRARVAYIVGALVLGFYTAYAFTVPDWQVPSLPGRVTLAQVAFAAPVSEPGIVFMSLFVLATVAYLAVRNRQLLAAGWAILFMWYFSGVALLIRFTTNPGVSSGAIVLMMVLGALLIGQRGVVAGLGLGLGTMLIRAISNPDYASAALSVVTFMMQAVGASLIIFLLLRYARLTREESASEAIAERIVSSEILTQIAQQVAQRRSLDEVLNAVVGRITDKFDFIYHAQVFLLTSNSQQARLVASTGTVGQKLIEAGHKLAVGSQSVIGQVTYRGETIVAHAGSADGIHRRNELLLETAVEAAFPLRIGSKVIGALDLQSKQADAFKDENLLATFQALADSISLAIDNVSQYENAQGRLQENEKLVDQLRESLAERERLNERLTGRAWVEYLRGAGDDYGLSIDFLEGSITPQRDWTASLQEALDANHLVQQQNGDSQIIAVPLRVRGQVVGAMEFELDKDHPFSPEDLDLVQEISERFGLAAENVRLLDESQRLAQRETLVNQITSRLQTNNNVEATLTEAARGLREAIKAQKVSIRLGSPPAAAVQERRSQS